MKRLLLVALVCLFSLGASAENLPFVNGSEYITTLVVVNPTSTFVNIPGFYEGFGARVIVPARGVLRVAGWGEAGIGVKGLTLPAPLFAYSEIKDPNGVIIRLGGASELTLRNPIQYQDLIASSDFRTYIFLFSAEGSAVTVREYAGSTEFRNDGYLIAAGATKIASVADGTDRVVLEVGLTVGGPYPRGKVYAFAFVSKQPRGELIAVQSTAVLP